MLKPIIQKIKEKSGFQSIEFTIIMLIVVVMIGFMADMTIIGIQRANMSREFQSIVNIVERQSGIAASMPTGFSGQSNTYYTPSSFVGAIENLKEENSLGEVSVYINDRLVTDQTTFHFSHKETFTMRIEYTANWGMLSKLIPGFSESRVYKHDAVGFTEYRGDYDNWGGE